MEHRKTWRIRGHNLQEACPELGCGRLITQLGKVQHYKDFHPAIALPQPAAAVHHHHHPQPHQHAHDHGHEAMQLDQQEPVGLHVPIEDPPYHFFLNPQLSREQVHQHPEPHTPPVAPPQPAAPETAPTQPAAPQHPAPQPAQPPLKPELYKVRQDSAYVDICAAVMRRRNLSQVDMDFIDLVYNKLHLAG